jgi:hypothetical protein
LQSVADEHDPGLATAGAPVQIDRPDLHVRDLDVAREPARHQRGQRIERRVAHLLQPRIVHVTAAAALELALDPERVAQGNIEPVGEHD